MMAGPMNRPTSPKVSSPPNTPNNAITNGSRTDDPISAGCATLSPTSITTTEKPNSSAAASRCP